MKEKINPPAIEIIRSPEAPGRCNGRLPVLLAVFFGLFLFFSAFSIALAQISLGIAVVSFLPILIRERSAMAGANLKPLFVAWSLYVTWLVLASVFNDNPLRSLSNIREEWLMVIVLIGVYLNRNPVYSHRLLLVLAGALLLISFYGIVQHFTGFHILAGQHIHKAGDSYRLSGNFSHPLTFGYYVVTATVFFLTYLAATLKRHHGWGLVLLFAATSTGLVASALCNSRGPMFALATGLIAVGWLLGRFRWTLIGLAAVVLIALTLSPGLAQVFTQRVANDWHLGNQAGRLFIWRHSLAIAEDNPVLGCGPGNFGESYDRHLQPENQGSKGTGHAHNDFIHSAAVAGFPAMILYMIFWSVACRHFWQTSRMPDIGPRGRALALAALAATVVFLAGSLTEAAFADEELRQLVLALWACSWQPASTST